jgi:hypothetical protein
MRPSVSSRDRRTLGIGIGLIVTLVVLSRGVPALRLRLADQVARDTALRGRLAFVREAQQKIAPMRDSLRARDRRLAALNSQLITATTPNAAAAMLGALIEQIADDVDVRVSSLELRADSSSRAAVIRVTVRASGEGDVRGLSAFLKAVECQSEPMVVRTLAAASSDPLGGDDKVEVLRFDVTIEGLALLTAEHFP